MRRARELRPAKPAAHRRAGVVRRRRRAARGPGPRRPRDGRGAPGRPRIGRHRLLDDQQPGGGRRRARHRQDRRQAHLRHLRPDPVRARRARASPPGQARARRRVRIRAAPARRPPARALAAQHAGAGGGRAAVGPLQRRADRLPRHDPYRGHRRQRSRRHADRPLGDRRRRLRHRPPQRWNGAGRHLVLAARAGRARRGHAGLRLAPAGRRLGSRPPLGPPRRGLPRRAPPGDLLRPGNAHRADDRPRPRTARHRLRRAHDRRPDGVRLDEEPLRRHAALDRPPNGARSHPRGRAHGDPPLRREQRRAHRLPRERRGPGLPAQPVLAVGVPRRAARRHDAGAGVGQRRRARRTARASSPSSTSTAAGSTRWAGWAGSARASASTPFASSTMPATSSRSARPTRCTPSTCPTPPTHASAARSSCWATRPICTRSAATSSSAWAATRPRRDAWAERS